MKIWLAHHRHALASSLQRMVRHPLATFFVLVSLAVALSLPAGLAAALAGLQNMAGGLPGQGTLTVYIRNDASADDRTALERRIHALPGLARADFISRTSALADLSRHLGLPDLSAELPDNPLPDAWQLMPDHLSPQLTRTWTDRLTPLPGVDLVLGDQDWITRLYTLIALGQRIVLAISILLATGIVTITGNIIRLQILTRQNEIEVSRLIGATDRFIQRPFLYFGAVQGLLAGLLAWGILAVGLAWITPQLHELSQLFGARFSPAWPSPVYGFALAGFSGALGWLGAWLAVRLTLLR